MIIKPHEYHNTATDEYSELISKYTVQLFINKRNSKWQKPDYLQKASSVLMGVNNKFYLLTAGHVLKWFIDKKLGALVGNIYHEINGKKFYIFKNTVKLNELIDIGIIELDQLSINFFTKNYDFLELKYSISNHIITNELKYLIFGYPINKTDFNPVEKKLKVIGWKFLTKGLTDNEAKLLKLNTNNNSMFHYIQREIIDLKTGNQKRSPYLEGLSGCGIWYLPELYYKKDEIKHPFLIGINHGQDVNRRYIIAHKIDYIFNCIKKMR